jgi:hypothetical protein
MFEHIRGCHVSRQNRKFRFLQINRSDYPYRKARHSLLLLVFRIATTCV